jgi:hypothetical protein
MSNEARPCPATPADQGVEIKEPIDGAGNLITATKTPILQYSWAYNLINTQLHETSVTGIGSSGAGSSMAYVQTGASASSSATLTSKKKLKYRPGQPVDIQFTAKFTPGVVGSTQVKGWGSAVDGLFVGYNGASMGVLHRNDSVDTWVPQADFTEDALDGSGESKITVDPTKVNLYRIHMLYLGAGDINFYVYRTSTGSWYEFHRISHIGTLTTLIMKNPNLSMYMSVANTTNATNIITYVGCWAGFIMGPKCLCTAVEKSMSNTKAGVTTQTNILTIRNKATFNTEVNLTEVFPSGISFAVDGNKNSIVRVHHNATLGGTPAYTDIDTGVSCVEYDTAGTTVTGGHIEAIYAVAKVGSGETNLDSTHLVLQPGDTATISCESSRETECTVAIIWKEDF